MKYNLKFYYFPTRSPYFNLAAEDQLLKVIKPDEKILLVYQNDPCVVLGRFQNPWREINMSALGETMLVRRQSGGGTVYHDEGNLCFSFLHGVRDHHKEDNNKIIIKALEQFGLNAYASERSDLKIDDKKFSGSAFKQKKDSSFHHGTLLFHSKLERLNGILDSPLKNLEGKGILSNPSKVVNLSELNSNLTMATFIPELLKSFEKFYGATSENCQLDFDNQEYLEFLESWQWCLGETPLFGFDLEGVDFKVKNARIIHCSRAHLEGIELKKKNINLIDEDLREGIKDFFV